MGLIPIAVVLLLAITSIESSYYYYTTANHYFTPHSPSIASPYIQSPYAYYASRLSKPVYYIRRHIGSAPGRPVRKLARSYRVQSQEAATTIILNDTVAVPFTVSKSALSTTEYEKNPNDAGEEGVGPAIEVESLASASRLSPRSKVSSIASKGASAGSKDSKVKSKVKSAAKKPSFEPEVVYSDIHPIYVKPPNDFRPVVYPNRLLDGVRYTNKLSNQVNLSPIPPPFPYGYPRGLSSWSLGGPKAISRGNYWESLSSDEALNLQPEANTIHPSTSNPTASAANFNGRPKLSHSQRPVSLPPFMPWFLVPSTSSLYSYEVQYPSSPGSSITIMPLTRPRTHVASSKAGSNPPQKEKKIVPSTRNKTESAEGIRTKLPVGLSSWMLGGVRDLTGKHWKMPDLFVDNVAVVEIDKNNTKDASGTKNSDTDMDTMMTSDGDYEKVVPVVSEAESEREEEDSLRDGGVVFDDDPEFLNANNNIPIS